MTWEGLTPPYRTIVADPPWDHSDGYHGSRLAVRAWHRPAGLRYSTMTLTEIEALPVPDIAADDAHLYLWTTARYLESAQRVARNWGFRFSQMLVWCKPPQGIGPGGAFAQTTEYIVFGKRGSLAAKERVASNVIHASRGAHSEKPAAFFDLVERVSPGPYVELFCRQPRFGWDSWGHGYENFAEATS